MWGGGGCRYPGGVCVPGGEGPGAGRGGGLGTPGRGPRGRQCPLRGSHCPGGCAGGGECPGRGSQCPGGVPGVLGGGPGEGECLGRWSRCPGGGPGTPGVPTQTRFPQAPSAAVTEPPEEAGPVLEEAGPVAAEAGPVAAEAELRAALAAERRGRAALERELGLLRAAGQGLARRLQEAESRNLELEAKLQRLQRPPLGPGPPPQEGVAGQPPMITAPPMEPSADPGSRGPPRLFRSPLGVPLSRHLLLWARVPHPSATKDCLLLCAAGLRPAAPPRTPP
ncbi:uncharacterized protein ACIBXB_007770 [Morphnus guianensis]